MSPPLAPRRPTDHDPVSRRRTSARRLTRVIGLTALVALLAAPSVAADPVDHRLDPVTAPGTLELEERDGLPRWSRDGEDPAEREVVVSDDALVTLEPEGSDGGAPPVWLAGSATDRALRWDTGAVARATVGGGPPAELQVALDRVDGPGRVGLVAEEASGAHAGPIVWDPAEAEPVPLDVGGTTTTAVVFAAAGVYDLGFVVSGSDGAGREHRSTTGLRFVVGPAEPVAGLPAVPTPAPPVDDAPVSPTEPDGPGPDLPAPAEPPAGDGAGAPPATAPRVAALPTTPRAPAQAGERVVIRTGHVDVGPRVVDGRWTVQMKDDTVTPIVWRDLADVVLAADDVSRISIPAGDQFAFLGAAGDDVWLLPQVQQADIVWPGWNTQHETVTSIIDGSVTWTLRGVRGPGDFVLFLSGAFGAPQVLFDTKAGLPQSMEIARNTHVHGNWAFSERGIYHLEMEMAAVTTDGTRVTDTKVLALAIGDGVDPQDGFGAGGGGAGGGGGADGGGAGGGGGGDGAPGDGPGSGDGPGLGGGDGAGAGSLGGAGSDGGGPGASGSGRTPGPGGPGALASTGVDDVATRVGLGIGLIAMGWSVHTVASGRRRTTT